MQANDLDTVAEVIRGTNAFTGIMVAACAYTVLKTVPKNVRPRYRRTGILALGMYGFFNATGNILRFGAGYTTAIWTGLFTAAAGWYWIFSFYKSLHDGEPQAEFDHRINTEGR